MESPESWFHRRATFYVEAQILFHLSQAGVLSFLNKEGAQTARQIADSLQLEVGATDALLDYVYGVDDLLDRSDDGKYSLSEFGKSVVSRFSDMNSNGGKQSVNMFDVRVGAYGPVWQNLGRMMSGDGRYGQDFQREGRFAEKGVFKLAMNFWNSLFENIEAFAGNSIIEVGLTTVLLERLAATYPGQILYGLDKNKVSIERNAASAAEKAIGNIRWINSDFFSPENWCKAVDTTDKGLVYSLHFHELIAQGEEKFVEVLRELRTALPNWAVLAFEQPRLAQDDRDSIPETQWLYGQSNILIHHLIGNGRILSRDAWLDLGREAGCRKVSDRSCNYLGYRAFLFEL